ncbi:GTPase IMAP family member 8-like [Engraulis encrasicolus]|uniref:GTPase IMAP family member 8-like n=1 Tax=Engraulis encrasicolus TaxID=184585 RepID=UPI002FD1B7F1
MDHKGGVPHIPDMRIVLLGGRSEGKSSSGNTILGRREFGTAGRTAECVKREGETAGRHITVVEAPGWWANPTVEQTPERDKGEIVLSVSLCPPGPHALLLVIRVDVSFTETHRRAVQEHMELLGERVWSHTIVLFTRGDCLGDTSIEQHIESGGEALQWVVEKCGNRYHVVDNKKSDGGQVTELLDKIEEMVAGNRGHHVDFDAEIMNGLMKRKKEEKRRAEERKMKVKKQRETLRSSAGGVSHIPDMRIVLLGRRYDGKSSSGNTILGRQEFGTAGRTAECVKREGETAGRHITVVEAPGWWKNLTVEQTPERDKGEIVLSVSLCPPGPHALLLVISVSESFTETNRRAVQEHMELLGERLWSHTILLFIAYGDWLGDTSIEQHIESGGEALQWVVEKCGNRYHVVDNKKSDGGQVTELLDKIEETVAGNRGHHVDFDANIINGLIKRKKEEKRRADERKMKVKKQRETLRSSAGGVPHITDMRIVLLGHRDAGKSSSGNTILGRQEFGTAGRTAECVKREGETAGRHITVVEAPGWWKNLTVEQTPERDKGEIVLRLSLCPPGPHALLLVIDVSLAFIETDRRAVQEHMELLGDRVWSHTILLFTCGDWLGVTSIEQHIESGGEALQWLVEKCGNRYHVVDNKKSDGGQVTELLDKIEEMVAGSSGERSMDFPLTFTDGQSEDSSRTESAYASSTSPPVSELTRRLETLSTASSTRSSGYGTAQREKAGSADSSSSMSPHSRVGGRGGITQPNPSSELTNAVVLNLF